MSATVAAVPTTTASLILLRMAIGAKSPPASVVREDVGKLLQGRKWSEDEFAPLRDELASAGYLAVKGKTMTLTDAGRAVALAFVGVPELPPRWNWGAVKAELLLPRATGLTPEAAAKLNTGDKLTTYLLARKYDLPFTPGSTTKQLIEALACRELGHPEETSLEGLLRRIISKVMQSDEILSKKDLLAQFPRYGTGLNDGRIETVRTALLRQWLTQSEGEAPLPADRESHSDFDLTLFVNTVKALARTSPASDRFHGNKAYIAAVWRASQRESGFPRMTLGQFKARLLEASAAGLLTLGRADLVQEMPASLVADSETAYLNATFHFVLIEGDRP